MTLLCLVVLSMFPCCFGLRVGAAQMESASDISPWHTIVRNAASMVDIATNATSQNLDLITFAEFLLVGNFDFSSCNNGSSFSIAPYSEIVPEAGSLINCSSQFPLAVLGCSDAARHMTISYNTVERATEGNHTELFFNTQVIVANGTVLARYRKYHPPLELVTFNVSGVRFGVFTCYDILFDHPKQDLVAEGISYFSYSSAIPIVGATAVQLFSAINKVTVVSSDLTPGQSIIVQKGLTVARTP
eukprot:CAMPEP_0176475806 /NCGR_PEP_ID=MMETSP0127-20121128/43803_1 /TAXON_ID=938130 /ORGANISM="Platyophrya macrostoma, Strain WH" /LENGTH=244 /DNA_ID=CAMNT_0017871427 /DNA_START=62 /DNA_END=792 /DNA_ORIENTATION=-